jgi:hypothetical protein
MELRMGGRVAETNSVTSESAKADRLYNELESMLRTGDK